MRSAGSTRLAQPHSHCLAVGNNWRKALSDQKDESKRRLKELEAENARLKKMYADLSLNHDILQQGYDMLKKWQAQDAKKS